MGQKISGRNHSWLICAFIFLTIAGCAARQDETAEMVFVPAKVTVNNDLSKTEKAALESTGIIDKNVPDHAMKDIEREYKQLLKEKRQVVCAFSQRSEKYLSYAREVFRKRGMPEELANLAIVESGYRPEARSSAGAAGAWQFMPETGLHYGLAQDSWQDERLDPYKATEAAADYLQKLYRDFGDWPTAIAAYNAGEGKMSRALSGTGGKNFYEAKYLNHVLDGKAQLREETKQYVPRFLAVTKIMRNLPQLGFEPINPEKAPTILRYSVEPGTDLQELSKACSLDWKTFSTVNPHHKRTITCTDKQTFVYLPEHVREKANAYLASNNRKNFSGWKLLKVSQAADSLEKIAERSHTSLASLKIANPGVGKLKVGQTLLLPAGVDMRARIKEIKNIAAKGGSVLKTHKVKAKDTLYSIAKKYNVDIESLKKHNSISGALQAGTVINIPGGAANIAGSSGKIGKRKTCNYIVQAKDSLWNIARRHNISVESLKRLNKVDEKSLKVGASLIVAEE